MMTVTSKERAEAERREVMAMRMSSQEEDVDSNVRNVEGILE
jgi:hypothetical protein